MITFEHAETDGWAAAIRGARNPLESWDKSDGYFIAPFTEGEYHEALVHPIYIPGEKDIDLLLRLATRGPDHGKALRFISVSVDITAPLFWWHEMDQYKVGTATNSTSIMHTGARDKYKTADFTINTGTEIAGWTLKCHLDEVLDSLNYFREKYQDTKDLAWFRAMRAIMPAGYNYRKTWTGNYQVVRNIYQQRKSHRLREWSGAGGFCDWASTLPYSELITAKWQRE